MKAPCVLHALSCVILVACASGGELAFDDAGPLAPDAGGDGQIPPATDAASDGGGPGKVPTDAAGDAPDDAAGNVTTDAATDAPGEGSGKMTTDAAGDAPAEAAGGCPANCSYGCTNGGCNLSCDGVDANCAAFPGTYCAWEGAWTCQKYSTRGDYCGTDFPECAPPLACKNIDQNGNYSPQPTCEP